MKNKSFWLLFSIFLACIMSVSYKVSAAEEPEYNAAPEKVGILQEGQLLPTADVFIPEKQNMLSAQDAYFVSASEALYQGMKEHKETINLSGYQVPKSEFSDLWYYTFYGNGDLFYVNWTSGYYSSAGYITDVGIIYKDSFSNEDINTFYTMADSILNAMPAGLNPQEKALYLHDYLATHCEYDLSYSKYNAYNVLVEKSAVCQGYALAYEFLCKRAGLTVYYVTSEENNHAWNIVMVDGRYYFVDCTWDDPSNYWYESRCLHKNFLRSRDGMVSTNHKISNADWTCYVMGNVSDLAVDSTKYDNYYWSDINSAMPFIGTTQAYVLSTDRSNVYIRTNYGTVKTVAIGTTATWREMEGGYYSDSYGSMTAARGDFYFNSESAIYRMTADGTVTKFYDLTAEELSTGYLYGLVTEGNCLAYSTAVRGWKKSNDDSFNYGSYTRKLLQICKVSFDANGGSGEMGTETLAAGSSLVLPACGFTAPTDKGFIGWNVNGILMQQGESVTVTKDMTINAKWRGNAPAVSAVFAHTCTVGNDLSLNYYVEAAPFEDFKNVRLVVEKRKYNTDGTYTMQTKTISDYSTGNTGNNGEKEYKFTYRGLFAYEMGDELNARIVAEKGGVTYESNEDTYCIKTYAINNLKKDGVADKLKRLLVDMLNYGTQAQIYFNYNKANPVNAELTDAMLAYGTTGNPALTSYKETIETAGATASFKGHTLITGSNIELKYYMGFDDGVNMDNVTMRMSYTATDGTPHDLVIPASQFNYDSAADEYSCKIATVATKDFSCKITAGIYEGDKLISETDYYSIGSYINNQLVKAGVADDVKTLLAAMGRYGVSAENYFKK